MESSTLILGDEIREERAAGRGQRPLRKKRKRFARGNRTNSDEGRKQQFNNTTPPCHAVFKRLVPSLLGVVALKFQAISEDPFKTCPIQSWSFLGAILMYSLILLARKHSQNQRNKLYLKIILCRVALAFEVVSSLSLISLLLQRFPGLVLVYNSWAIFVLISAFPVLQYTYNLLLTGIKAVHHVFLIHFAWLRGLNSSEEPRAQRTRPPV